MGVPSETSARVVLAALRCAVGAGGAVGAAIAISRAENSDVAAPPPTLPTIGRPLPSADAPEEESLACFESHAASAATTSAVRTIVRWVNTLGFRMGATPHKSVRVGRLLTST